MEEYFGKYPIKTETTVTREDAPRLEGWTCRQYDGVDVTIPGSKKLLMNLDDLKVGVEIEFTGLFDEYHRMPVIAVTGKKADADNGSMGAFLEFDKDDRHCWVANSYYNSSALAKGST